MSSNGYQQVILPTSYTTSYIGLVTSKRNSAANAQEGGNGFYSDNLTTCHVASCSVVLPSYWLTLGY